jgi:hypothetical protein
MAEEAEEAEVGRGPVGERTAKFSRKGDGWETASGARLRAICALRYLCLLYLNQRFRGD